MRRVQSTLFGLLAASGSVFANSNYNLTPGVSPISHDVYELHMTVLWICVVIGAIVFGAMFYAMYYHRKSRGAKAANFHSHTWLEITWTIIPCLILIAMAIPATKVLLNMNNNDQEAVTIKITGYQWKWHYEYLEDNLSFFSDLSTPQDQIHNKAPKGPHYLREVDHPLVLPIHQKIRFLITSNDVNHAWWVPDFGVKRDAISGIINEGWTVIDKPGTYRGQCAELCGINHSFMPIVVIALPEQAYKDWVAKQKGQATAGEADTNREWTLKELMAQGEQTFNKICAACHQVTGLGTPPTFPALKGSKVATGPLDKHVETVMNGVSGTAMQAFKTQLSDVELASAITYERNAWGNNTNTFVQPIQIKAYRDGKLIADALTVKPGAAAPADKTKSAAEAKPAPPPPVPTTPTAVPVTPALNAAKTAPAPVVEDPLKAAIARGEKVYQTTCAVCHQVNGAGIPPTFPALKSDPVTTGPVAPHINRVLNGRPGTAMQAFKDQMKDQDLADVITYERNAWGNDVGDLVTPEQIKAARSLPPTTDKGT
ncbi:MAG: cytochrome c oxidase subunit II [Gammaproteobacteria bacterium]